MQHENHLLTLTVAESSNSKVGSRDRSINKWQTFQERTVRDTLLLLGQPSFLPWHVGRRVGKSISNATAAVINNL